jgi:DNA-binding transcriptional regulator GbsR (MarR family)
MRQMLLLLCGLAAGVTWGALPTLNLIVQKWLKEIDSTLSKIRRIVTFFKKSSHPAAKLKIMQEQMNIPVLKPKQDVCTRWNSTFEMLSRILEIKDAVVATLAIIDKEGINSLVPNKWNIVRVAKEILSIFNDVPIEVSAEKNVSISKKIELVDNLKRHVQKHLNREDLPQEIMQMLQFFMNELGNPNFSSSLHISL